jgi:hypothetical protein
MAMDWWPNVSASGAYTLQPSVRTVAPAVTTEPTKPHNDLELTSRRRARRTRPKPLGSSTSTAIATTALLVVPRPAVPWPRSRPPTQVSSTSNAPSSRSRSGRTIARRSLCIHVHAVRYEPIPSTRCNPSAETPFFCEVTNHTAANQSVSGSRDLWKIVPAVTDVLRRHDRHNHNPRRRLPRLPAIAARAAEPLQRSRDRYEAHASSSGNQLVNCANVAGKSPPVTDIKP